MKPVYRESKIEAWPFRGVNLLPWREHRREQRRRWISGGCVLGILICIGGLISWAQASRHQLASLEADQLRWQQQLTQERRQHQDLQRAAHASALKQRQIKRAQRARRHVRDLTRCLQSLSHSIPSAVLLNQLTADQRYLNLKGKTTNDPALQRWVAQLQRALGLKNLQISEMRGEAGTQAAEIGFTLQGTWR